MAQKPTARRATDPNAALLGSMGASTPRPRKGVKAGLRDGESRITCVLKDEQSQVLHDWAKTTGRTFREITLAMADRYIAEVIEQYGRDGGKLKRQGVEPPATYAHLYAEDETEEDEFARYF